MFHRKTNPGTDAARKALFINKISVFRVDDIATLKTLKLLRQSLLRAAPNYLLFNIGKLFSGLDKKIYSRPRARTRASGSGSAPRNSW